MEANVGTGPAMGKTPQSTLLS
ncbi:hypothetical protein LINPERPRIM_LOCUS33369 [Linum perenne]